jgi:ankyrin repeat protein
LEGEKKIEEMDKKTPLTQLQITLFKCVREGNVAEFKRLTRKFDNELLKVRDEYGQTLLHVACDQDQLELVKHIVEKMKANINIPDKNGWTPLHCATKENNLEVADYLLERGADAGALTHDRDTPLHYFVRCSYDKPGLYEKIFKVLLLRGCDIDKQNSIGESALHLASYRGSEKCVSLLLEKSAKPNLKNK